MPHRLFICLLTVALGMILFYNQAISQEAGVVLNASDNGASAVSSAAEDEADHLKREEAPASPTLLDATAAKMAFLLVLLLVGVGYVWLRNQPSSKDFKMKNKRK